MRIEKFTDKQKLILRLTDLAESGRYVFRGYTKQDQLLPNLMRKNVVDVEKELLFEFERFGNQYLDTSNPIDFMSYAQHFGLSTRLMDFTYNPFVALFFALFTPKNTNYKNAEDKDFYYIRVVNIDDNILIHHVPIFNRGDFFEINSMAKRCVELFETVDMMFNLNHDFGTSSFMDRKQAIFNFFTAVARQSGCDERHYVEINYKKIDSKKMFLIDPNQSNQRLVMQQGLFMFPYDLNEEHHRDIVNNNSTVIMIHKSLRESLQRYLDTIGINSFRLMPDLPSVCEAVERKVKDKRNSQRDLFKKAVSLEEVLQFVEQHKDVPISQISNDLGASISTVKKYVDQLISQGLIDPEKMAE